MGQSIIGDSEYYNNKRIEGEMFEGFVYAKLEHLLGIEINSCDTKKEQFDIGENYFGMEIKNDEASERTGNLFVEYQEKSKSTNENWVHSGIFRNDNSWLYLIGNTKAFYIFSIKDLRIAYNAKDASAEPKHERKMCNRGTSWGFLLKGKKEINEYVLKTITL
tara:strand:+ start:525 stop:1013 length:489 start_codon:yes stop_codon:yes gene_type:complete